MRMVTLYSLSKRVEHLKSTTQPRSRGDRSPCNVECNDNNNSSKVEHPDYSNANNDIALLRLHRGLDLSNLPNINSVCWPTVSPAAGVQAMTSGWGLKWQHFGLFGTAPVLQKVTTNFRIYQGLTLSNLKKLPFRRLPFR